MRQVFYVTLIFFFFTENKMAKVRKLLLLVSLFVIVTTTYAMQCNQIYSEDMSAISPANGRYSIEILDNPSSYIPGQKYRGKHIIGVKKVNE